MFQPLEIHGKEIVMRVARKFKGAKLATLRTLASDGLDHTMEILMTRWDTSIDRENKKEPILRMGLKYPNKPLLTLAGCILDPCLIIIQVCKSSWH